MTINKIDLVLYSNIGKFVTAPKANIKKIGGQDSSSSTRGVFGGGEGGKKTITYISIETMGNATSFGNLATAGSINGVNSCSSSSRGLFLSGDDNNFIDYITIATTGNATTKQTYGASFSNGHGGLS